MSERYNAMTDFLRSAGWGAAQVQPLPGDASTRRYHRVAQGARQGMLMDQPQQAETPASPPDATPEQRQTLGYNAMARLAGADCGRFVAVATFLRSQGLSAPEIYAVDCDAGFVLMEDFGDHLYADILAGGGNEGDLYKVAVEALAQIHAHPAPAQISPCAPLHHYDEMALLAETALLTDWYLPLALGRNAGPDELAAHRALWSRVLSSMKDTDPVFVHRDYHAQNLLWLPGREGMARVGLIDFQDAVAGSPGYDLVSLLEDARREVAPELAEAMIAHYISVMRGQGISVDETSLKASLAIMAAQRNAKIAGIFARLHVRDGKPRYLNYLPRVWRYLQRDLGHPSLAELKAWYEQTLPRAAREGRIQGAVA